MTLVSLTKFIFKGSIRRNCILKYGEGRKLLCFKLSDNGVGLNLPLIDYEIFGERSFQLLILSSSSFSLYARDGIIGISDLEHSIFFHMRSRLLLTNLDRELSLYKDKKFGRKGVGTLSDIISIKKLLDLSLTSGEYVFEPFSFFQKRMFSILSKRYGVTMRYSFSDSGIDPEVVGYHCEKSSALKSFREIYEKLNVGISWYEASPELKYKIIL